MIATAAEANPSVFSSTPLVDVEQTLVPSYLRLVCCLCSPPSFKVLTSLTQSKYLDAHFSLTKFCVNQFKGPHRTLHKADLKIYHETISKAKSYDDLTDFIGGIWNGEEDMRAIVNVVESRSNYRPVVQETNPVQAEDETTRQTPPYRPNPEPPGSGAPLGPSNDLRLMIPAGVSRHDAVTPTPSGGIAF